MTKHDLKELAAMGAELGAAKAENDRLRGLLRELREITSEYAWDADLEARVDATLSQQAEPTDAFTAVDMATAAAQGFRDGQAAVEQATTQDERKTFEVEIPDISAIYDGRSFIPYRSLEAGERLMTVAQHLRIEKQLRAALTRPAQTEQQPVAVVPQGLPELLESVRLSDEEAKPHGPGATYWNNAVVACQVAIRGALCAAPIAQTAPQGKFRMGDLVKKSTGSEWEGRVVGWYSTEQTKEGYAVESSAHRNSVQIYPAKALELVPMAAKEA